MVALTFHIHCLLSFFLLIQSVSLYKIYASDDTHPDYPTVSLNEELNSPIQDTNMKYGDLVFSTINNNNRDSSEEWNTKFQRSVSLNRLQPVPQRRNSRPHWNPLVAAYKRCGELIAHEERESCFKDAVQMLFLYKLKK